jgi:hypothetical protein
VKRRQRKQHIPRWTWCDGCGGRLDMDDAWLMVRETKDGNLTVCVTHGRDVCQERMKARTYPLSEERRLLAEWHRFVREQPAIAIAVLTLNAMEASR